MKLIYFLLFSLQLCFTVNHCFAYEIVGGVKIDVIAEHVAKTGSNDMWYRFEVTCKNTNSYPVLVKGRVIVTTSNNKSKTFDLGALAIRANQSGKKHHLNTDFRPKYEGTWKADYSGVSVVKHDKKSMSGAVLEEKDTYSISYLTKLGKNYARYNSPQLGEILIFSADGDMVAAVFQITGSKVSGETTVQVKGEYYHMKELKWIRSESKVKKVKSGKSQKVKLPMGSATLYEFQNHIFKVHSIVINGKEEKFTDADLVYPQYYKGSLKTYFGVDIDKRDQNTSEPAETNSNSGENSAAERLKKLKGLFDQGLITEEEYNSKRQAILDDL